MDDIGDLVTSFRSEFGKESAIGFADSFIPESRAGFLPTNCFALDYVIGRGGTPLGRLIEIFGPFSSGKSTVAASIMASFQQNDGFAILFDTEHSYEPEWMIKQGVDPSKVFKPEVVTLQEAFIQIRFLCRKIREDELTSPCVIVFDSISALPVQEEMDGDFDNKQIGIHARYISSGFRVITGLMWDSRVALIVVSQQKHDPMNPYKIAKLGGETVNFHAATQIKVNRVSKHDDHIVTRLEATKNKIAPPFRQATCKILFSGGIDDSPAYAEVGASCGIFGKSAAGWFEFEGVKYRASNLPEEARKAIRLATTFGVSHGSPEVANEEGLRQVADVKSEDTTPEGPFKTIALPSV